MKEKKYFVVTRRGRRVEPRNYEVLEEAQERAHKLRELLKSCSPACSNKVSIVHTSTPNTIC